MKWYFDIDSMQDTVDELNGQPFAGMTVSALVNAFPCFFWAEKNVNGIDVLCTDIVLETECELTLNVSGTPYKAAARPFIAVENGRGIFGPHPTVIFKPGPKK